MIFLKSFIFNVCFLLFSTLVAIIFFPFLLSKNITIIIASYWAKIILFLLRKICGIKIIINDVKKLYEKGTIFAVRHESILDTILFLAYRPSIKYIVNLHFSGVWR